MALIYFTPGLKGSYLILSLQKGIIGYYLLSSSSLLLTPFWRLVGLSSSVIIRLTWLWWGFYSSRIFDGDMTQSTSFNSGGVLVELSLWWRFLFTQLQLCPVVGISLLLLLLLCSSVRCGGALVVASSTHTAITVQSSRSLTYQPPARVRSPLTTILVGTGRSSTSSTLSEEEVVALSSDWL
jgi:hypothetical protein